MYLNAPNTTSSNNNVLMRFVANSKELFTIKIFDLKGRKAKTISAESISEVQELKVKMKDLEDGVYILNAFLNGNFIKAFRYTKF